MSAFQIGQDFLFLYKINLIKNPERRNIGNTKFLEYFLSCAYMFAKTLMGDVDNLDNKVCVSYFIKSAFERCD